jgi:hypothetical protein
MHLNKSHATSSAAVARLRKSKIVTQLQKTELSLLLEVSGSLSQSQKQDSVKDSMLPMAKERKLLLAQQLPLEAVAPHQEARSVSQFLPLAAVILHPLEDPLILSVVLIPQLVTPDHVKSLPS